MCPQIAVRGCPPEARRAARQASPPLLAALRPWLEAQPSHLSTGSKLGPAHPAHTLRHRNGLTRFLHDGRLELDTNPVETLIRPLATRRKTALFAGHEVGAENGAENGAVLTSLLATCKLSGVDPAAHVAATLQAIVDGHPQSAVDDLTPWRFAHTTTPSSRAA